MDGNDEQLRITCASSNRESRAHWNRRDNRLRIPGGVWQRPQP